MWCWWPRWATVPGRTKNAEFSARRTAEGRGRKFCTKTILQRQWIFVLSREISEWLMRCCGTGFESQDKEEHRMDPAAGFIIRWMKASPGSKSPDTHFRRQTGGKRESRLRPETIAIACSLSWK